MEEQVLFQSGSIAIEGILHQNPGASKGVVVTHPHPLMGGNMYNPVVETIESVYYRKGFSTLRFNFRGTGQSQGDFDDGNGEVDDLAAAVLYLGRCNVKEIEVSGYSFGVWINTLALVKGHAFAVTSMVSPPVDFISFPDRVDIKTLRCVVSGSFDEYGTTANVEAFAKKCNPDVAIHQIQGADHFYSGKMMKLEEALMDSV